MRHPLTSQCLLTTCLDGWLLAHYHSQLSMHQSSTRNNENKTLVILRLKVPSVILCLTVPSVIFRLIVPSVILRLTVRSTIHRISAFGHTSSNSTFNSLSNSAFGYSSSNNGNSRLTIPFILRLTMPLVILHITMRLINIRLIVTNKAFLV